MYALVCAHQHVNSRTILPIPKGKYEYAAPTEHRGAKIFFWTRGTGCYTAREPRLFSFWDLLASKHTGHPAPPRAVSYTQSVEVLMQIDNQHEVLRERNLKSSWNTRTTI